MDRNTVVFLEVDEAFRHIFAPNFRQRSGADSCPDTCTRWLKRLEIRTIDPRVTRLFSLYKTCRFVYNEKGYAHRSVSVWDVLYQVFPIFQLTGTTNLTKHIIYFW